MTYLEAADRLADGFVDDAHLLANLLDLLQGGVDVLDLHLLWVQDRAMVQDRVISRRGQAQGIKVSVLMTGGVAVSLGAEGRGVQRIQTAPGGRTRSGVPAMVDGPEGRSHTKAPAC